MRRRAVAGCANTKKPRCCGGFRWWRAKLAGLLDLLGLLVGTLEGFGRFDGDQRDDKQEEGGETDFLDADSHDCPRSTARLVLCAFMRKVSRFRACRKSEFSGHCVS